MTKEHGALKGVQVVPQALPSCQEVARLARQNASNLIFGGVLVYLRYRTLSLRPPQWSTLKYYPSELQFWGRHAALDDHKGNATSESMLCTALLEFPEGMGDAQCAA